MAYGDDNRDIFWRAQLFRDGLRVRYDGVVREYAAWDDSCIDVRLTGECHIESRRLGTRGWYPPTDARDRDLLLAEVERNPDDGRSVFYLAQSYFELGDIDNARRWFARRIEMGGWYQEIYVAMWRTAETMARLGAPWLEVRRRRPEGLGIPTDSCRGAACRRLVVPCRPALPARLPLRQARRGHPVS